MGGNPSPLPTLRPLGISVGTFLRKWLRLTISSKRAGPKGPRGNAEDLMADKHFGCAALLAAVLGLMAGSVEAAPCGKTGAGFEAWKRVFAGEAQGNGIGPAAIAALMATNYSVGTIRADRGQKSFKLSLDQFMAKWGRRSSCPRASCSMASTATATAS